MTNYDENASFLIKDNIIKYKNTCVHNWGSTNQKY